MLFRCAPWNCHSMMAVAWAGVLSLGVMISRVCGYRTVFRQFSSSLGIKSIANDGGALAQRNMHALDSKIEFDETLHKYWYDGKPLKWSVSTFLAQYFHEFEAEKVAKNMMSSKNWPRIEYCHPCGTPFTKVEILNKWDRISEMSRKKGTEMHRAIENVINGGDAPTGCAEIEQFNCFFQKYIVEKDIMPYRCEWKIAAPDLDLAGCIDFVARDHDGKFLLVDWKRSKQLLSESNYLRKARYPITHMIGNNLSKYQLQLNLYKYILERYYGIQVDRMLIVGIHSEQADAKVIEVPVLSREIDNLVKDLQESN